MKNKWYYSLTCAALTAAIMITPACAEAVTEAASEAVTEAADEAYQVWESSTNLEDGIFTVYIQSHAEDKDGYYWNIYTGDKGDATLYELLTQSDTEEGYAYVGSFKALEGETGDDYIRIAHTNGFVVDEYMDFDIRIEDGVITEHNGGSHAFPTSDKEFEPVICGAWAAEDGSGAQLTLSLNPEGGFDGVVSGGTGGSEPYTFTAEYDAISDAFLYENGLIAFDPASESLENLKLLFHDPSFTEEDIVFVRAE